MKIGNLPLYVAVLIGFLMLYFSGVGPELIYKVFMR